MGVSIHLPKIDLHLTPNVYRHLIATGSYVSPPPIQAATAKSMDNDVAEKEKTSIMMGMKKFGKMWVKRRVMSEEVWEEYICVLKGAYLHFVKKPTDKTVLFNYYIRGAKVSVFESKQK